MKILLVGASGKLGRAVAAELGSRHELISAGRQSGDLRMDLGDRASVAKALARLGRIDAIASAAGALAFAPLLELTDADWQTSLQGKLMGQVNLALAGIAHLNDGGSITLTTGILSTDPIRTGTTATLVNRALEGFVASAANELPRGLRINAVSPGALAESADEHAGYFHGFGLVPAARAALGFARSIDGDENGRTYVYHH